MKIHRNFDLRLYRKFCKSFSSSSSLWGNPELYYNAYSKLKHTCLDCGKTIFESGPEPNKTPPFLIEGDSWVLPLVIGTKSEDGSAYISPILELNIPDQFNLFSPKCIWDLKEIGIDFNSEGRPEYLVNMRESSEDKKKSLSRIYRYHRKVIEDSSFEIRVFYPSPTDLLVHAVELDPHFEKYWNAKIGSRNMDFEREYWSTLATSKEIKCVTISKSGDLLAAGYFIVYADEIYWTQTKRKVTEETEKFRIGNSVVYTMIDHIYAMDIKKDLNLGIGWLDYKLIWKPETVYKPCLEIEGEEIINIVRRLYESNIDSCSLI